LNDQTSSLSDASSETAKFATNAGTMYSKILAYAIPFTAYMINNIKLLLGVLLVGIGSVIGGTLFMVEKFLDGINLVVNTAIDRLKMAYNGAQDILNKIGAGTAHRFEMGVTVTPHVNLGSASVFNEVGKTSDQMSQLVEVQRRLEAEGSRIDQRFDRVEQLTKLRTEDERHARGNVSNVGRGETIYKAGPGGFMVPQNVPTAMPGGGAGSDAVARAKAKAAAAASLDPSGLKSLADTHTARRKKAEKIIDDADKWSLSELRGIQEWFKETTKKTLPVSAYGQSAYHNKLKLDHRNAADVALNPSSKEGQLLIQYLQQTGTPFRAITAADVARGVKASAPHIHVGAPSHFFGHKTQSLGLSRKGDKTDYLVINDKVVPLSPEKLYAIQSFVQGAKGMVASQPLATSGALATNITPRLTTYEKSRRQKDEEYYGQLEETATGTYQRVGGKYQELFDRQHNLQLELSDQWRDANIARQHAELDTITGIERAEADLFHLRQQGVDDQLTDQRRLLRSKNDELDLTKRLQELGDEAATMSANVGLRQQVALLEELNALKREDIDAAESLIKSQVRVADQSVYHEGRANAKVAEYLASQKGITDIVADAKIGIIEQSFNGVDSVLDRIIPKMHGFGSLIKQMISDLLKLEASKFFMKILGIPTGSGQQQSGSSSGGGFSWKNIIGGLFNGGGKGQSDEESGGGSSVGGVGGYGSIIKNFKSNGLVGGLKGLIGLGGGGAAASLGAAAPIGAAGSWATAAGGAGALAGGAGAAGAGAAGAGGAAAGGGAAGLGALIPFLTNPITIAVAGAAIGAFLLWRHFRNGDEKKLRAAIKSAYGVDIKDMSVLKQIKHMGEQAFGKGAVGRRLQDVIKLDGVKSLVQQYGESTGQQANSLVTNAQYADPNFKDNQFARSGGSSSSSSFSNTPYQVTMPRSSSDESSGSGGGGSSSSGGSSNGIAPVLMAAFTGAMQSVADATNALHSKLKSTSPGDVLTAAVGENPEAVIDGLNEGLSRGHRRDDTLSNLGFRNGG
jgi:hypothetical protein